MVEWVKVGTNVVVGGALGAGDQLIQNADDKRIAEKPDLGIMAQYGTYYNYGIPILAIFGTAFGFLKGDWATRMVTAGSTLAGRKLTKQIAKGGAVPYTRWTRERQLEAARQRALTAAGGGARAQVGVVNELTIPIISDETMLV